MKMIKQFKYAVGVIAAVCMVSCTLDPSDIANSDLGDASHVTPEDEHSQTLSAPYIFHELHTRGELVFYPTRSSDNATVPDDSDPSEPLDHLRVYITNPHEDMEYQWMINDVVGEWEGTGIAITTFTSMEALPLRKLHTERLFNYSAMPNDAVYNVNCRARFNDVVSSWSNTIIVKPFSVSSGEGISEKESSDSSTPEEP